MLSLDSLRRAPWRLREDLSPSHLFFLFSNLRSQLRFLLLSFLPFSSLMCTSLLLHLLFTEHSERLTDFDGPVYVPLVVEAGVENDGSHIVHSGQKLERWHETHQLVVVRVVVPTENRDAVLGLELVAVRRVVDDYDVLHPSSHSLHILDELVIKESAVLSEEPLRCNSLRIQDVHQRNGILGQTGREDDHLVVLAHLLDELLAARSHKHVDLAFAPLNVNGQHDVGVLRGRERAVH